MCTARSTWHYGKNAVVDYGLHDEDGGKTISPFFVTNTGFLRARVQQNYPALTGELYSGEGSDNNGNRDDLGDIELTSLFSLLNIVVVTDQTQTDTHTGQLTISKKVLGKAQSGEDYTRHFDFTVELMDAAGKRLLANIISTARINPAISEAAARFRSIMMRASPSLACLPERNIPLQKHRQTAGIPSLRRGKFPG